MHFCIGLYYHYVKEALWNRMAAALTLPGTVGWSGTVDSHLSSLAFNWSGVPVKVSLSSLGMQLNSWAPLTSSGLARPAASNSLLDQVLLVKDIDLDTYEVF